MSAFRSGAGERMSQPSIAIIGGGAAGMMAAASAVEARPDARVTLFERNEDGWKMIALHEALAIDAPGAGAEFVKVVPGAAKQPEPAQNEHKADKKKDEKKNEKAKKKRSF